LSTWQVDSVSPKPKKTRQKTNSKLSTMFFFFCCAFRRERAELTSRSADIHLRPKQDVGLAPKIYTRTDPILVTLHRVDIRVTFTRCNRGNICGFPARVTRYGCHCRRIPFRVHSFIKLTQFCTYKVFANMGMQELM
jgi:hypothetical protein